MQELPVLGCSLDAAGLAEQRARYAALAPSVTSTARAPRTLTVEFDTEVDRTLLDTTLAVEAECCSFFAIARDGTRVCLSVSADDLDPTLDAIAYALGA
jgi:hypothetical protein